MHRSECFLILLRIINFPLVDFDAPPYAFRDSIFPAFHFPSTFHDRTPPMSYVCTATYVHQLNRIMMYDCGRMCSSFWYLSRRNQHAVHITRDGVKDAPERLRLVPFRRYVFTLEVAVDKVNE